MANVIVCGGREFDDREAVYDALYRCLMPGDVVWHGGARGADTLAGKVAESLGHAVVIVPAQWKRHGYSAGPIRNQLMLDLAEPRLVIAMPGGRGTADMTHRARQHGVPVKQGGGRCE